MHYNKKQMRLAQRLLVWVSSFAMLSVLIIKEDVLILISGLAYLILVNFIFYDLTRLKRNSIIQTLFVIFFSIGHVLKTAFVLTNVELYKVSGWNAVGSFDFGPGAMGELFAVQGAGILGAYLSFKLFWQSKKNRVIFKRKQTRKNSIVNSKILLMIWFLFAIYIIFLIYNLGFGMHGLKAENNGLPSGVAGFLLYVRNVFIFGVGLMLLDRIFQFAGKKDFYLFICLYLMVALYFSIASLSRSAFVGVFLPLVYSWYINKKPRLSISLLFKIISLFFLFMATASIVNIYRSTLYSNEASSSNLSFAVILAITGKVDYLNILVFAEFLVNRIEGSRELMAVISSDLSSPWAFFIEFSGGNSGIMGNVMGFTPTAKGKAFGMTFGLLGLLYLSKSIILVFIGVATFIWGLLNVERLFRRRGYLATSFFVCFTLFVNVWGNMQWFFMYRFGVIVCLVFLFLIFVFEPLFRTKIQFQKEHA